LGRVRRLIPLFWTPWKNLPDFFKLGDTITKAIYTRLKSVTTTKKEGKKLHIC